MKTLVIAKHLLFLLLAVGSLFASPALALFAGILFALIFGSIFPLQTAKLSSLLLQAAVVGLGFGMNLHDSLRASADGILFTIVSVVVVMCVGVVLGRVMQVDKRAGYLISAGTAICGGSAIAAISPVIKARAHDTSISLAVIFTLNAVAMLTFPYLGHLMELTQREFGMWSAIAIHDTSAVVGAAKMYGEEALQIATTVKLSRALWIIPLSFVSLMLFRAPKGSETAKLSIPWFILLFVVAMVINTYAPLPETLSHIVKVGSHKILALTLFLIGSRLSLGAIREAGFTPILLGIALWGLISLLSLGVIVVL